MDIVPNEWLLDYLNPAGDPRKRSFVLDFLLALWKNGHRLVIGRDNRFSSKFYRCMKDFGFCPGAKKTLSVLFRSFYDSQKIVIIDETTRLSGDLAAKAPQDDRYLLELGYSSGDRSVVTTDRRLKESCDGAGGIRIFLIGDLIKELKLDLVPPE